MVRMASGFTVNGRRRTIGREHGGSDAQGVGHITRVVAAERAG